MLFSKPSKSVGIDIGTHSVKAVQMSKAGRRFQVDAVGYAPVDRNQFNVDPIIAHANAVRETVRRMPVAQSLIVAALPGQTVVPRYPRLPNMPYEEIEQAIQNEASQNIPYELSEVFLDWSLLDTVTEGDESQLKVLLVAARHEVIEARAQIAEAAEIQYSVLTVDSLALADAAESCDFLREGETIALINLGATSTNIHFLKDGISNFIRDVGWGARELVQAIAKARHCDYGDAEALLARCGPEKEEDAAPVSEEEAGAPEQPEGAGGAPREPGGGSLLDPLEDELRGLGEQESEPVAPAGPWAGPPGGEEKDLTELLAPPLGRLVAEIRRSFDYYEHQLYERPVDRIIVSGGVAHMTTLRETLSRDLGVEDIQVADPSNSALRLSNDRSLETLKARPAQFMVAVGLAARGAGEL